MDTDTKNDIGTRKWFTVERVLLFAILALQAAIILWLWKEHGHLSARAHVAHVMDADLPVSVIQPRTAGGIIHRHAIPEPVARLQEAQRMFDEMDQMFASAINDFGHVGSVVNLDDGWDALMASPAMDMKERDNSYVVVFSLPGVRLSDVEVMLEGPILTVITSVHGEAGLKNQVGTFERAIQLPGPVGDASLAQAILTNGILRVSVPKSNSTGSSSRESKRLL